MDQQAFQDFVVAAARRASRDFGRIGHLKLTQTYREAMRIREPEMRHALAQCAEEKSCSYGIEVPTEELYRFCEEPGDRRVRARHDFVMFPDQRAASVLIELKVSTDGKVITKDFVKLICERAGGKAFIHLLPSKDTGTLPNLMRKYRDSGMQAAGEVAEKHPEVVLENDKAWFSVFVLIVSGDGEGAAELYGGEWTGLKQFFEAISQGGDRSWLSPLSLHVP